MNAGLGQFWDAAMVGFIFYIPLLVSVFFLESLPEPTEEDESHRAKRVTMNSADRIKFFLDFWPGVIFMTLYYILLEVFLDFRDDFLVELFQDMGYVDGPEIYGQTGIIVGFCVVIPIILFMLIKDPFWNFFSFHVLFIVAMAMLFLSVFIYDSGGMKGWPFMIINHVAVLFLMFLIMVCYLM
jgi:hypothetical protein